MYETSSEEVVEKSSPARKVLGRIFRGLYDVIESLVIAGAIVIFIYLFVASPHEVLGRSMEDNFWNGEYLLADKVSYLVRDPARGDVVIFKQTPTADYIKRVIGTPGDTIAVRDGSYYVNGSRLDESGYLESAEYTDPGSFLTEGEEYSIPKGKYFVSGDNRQHSSDSRTFGPIDKSQIKGRAVFIYWPFSHLKVISRPSYN